MPVLKVKKNGIWEEVSGGSSIEVDTTLTQTGQAADAKAVGDALAGKQPVGDYATEDYVDSAISAIPTPDVSGQIGAHNTDANAHNDIRVLISDLSTAVNNFLDVDDTTTDQLSEVLALINANKGTLESLTTSKVNVSDIINNLTTNSSNKVLSAAQGVAIKALIDTLQTELNNHKNNKSNPHGVTCAQIGALPSGNVNGTANKVTKFTGANSVGNSNITDDGSTITLGTKIVVQGNGSSYNEGIRILPASNGWSNVFFSANSTTSGEHDGGWLIGRRGAVGNKCGAIGDFSIENNASDGAGLTIHKDASMSLYGSKFTMAANKVSMQYDFTNECLNFVFN